MQNAFADWLFNVMFLGAIAALLVLAFHVLAAPVLGAMTTLAALALVLVVSAFWPRW
jgi:hypothetical protein